MFVRLNSALAVIRGFREELQIEIGKPAQKKASF